jgi:membrane fusion protein (multidrug efflux system)
MSSKFFPAPVFAAVLLVFFAAGCSKKEQAGNPGGGWDRGARRVAEARPVEVETARIGPIAAFLSFNSTIEVETAVDLFPEVSGLVEELLVEEGDRVKAGDILLRLDSDDQAVELEESTVNLRHLEATFERNRELFESGLINRQDFDTTRFALDQAKLRLQRAQLDMEHTLVRAPVSGVVTERLVQIGDRVTAGARLFALMSLDDMIARVFVPGRHLTSLTVGQEAVLTSEFLPGRSFEGWVKRISPVVDAKSGTFKVTVGIKPTEEPPPPGLFASVRVITNRNPKAVLVPKRAIVYEGGERYVFVVQDGVANRVRLGSGYEEGDVVEARSDISAGAAIVILGQSALKDQAAVRIVATKGSEAVAAETKSTVSQPDS